MILHFSQIGFTEDLTFTVILLSLNPSRRAEILPKKGGFHLSLNKVAQAL
jgi:hypothetical protein